MYLLDTVVLSELRKKERNMGLTAWIAAKPDSELFISVISIGEITRSISLQMKVNPDFAKALRLWLERLILAYGDRIVPVDERVARRCGDLSAQIGNTDADILVAATALEHDLAVVSRNEKHFANTGVRVINPWL
ncbi:MAG: type II toxin-antitoxin system VapC family toxin [Desulfobulbaceae bacterium]|jgi:predicted nucleic acid-binding protein|nr:type II toxin-antitoxin system VapC family toxin [Desulfobulbaceae bacterium]